MNATAPLMTNAEPEPLASMTDTHHLLPRPQVKLARITAILGVLILGAAVAGFMPRWKQQAETKKENVELSESTVGLVSPRPGEPSAGVILPAEVQPWLQASIYARVGGYLKRWNVDIGAHVEAGQVLAEIDTPEIDQQLDQARAQLSVAEANLKLAQVTHDRWQILLKSAAVSRQDADTKAAASIVAAATVEAERANVRRLEKTQAFQKVLAPFAGTVTVRNVDIGDLIPAGSGRELFHVAQSQSLRLYVRVPQSMSPDIRIGQSAQLLIPELPDASFSAKVLTTSDSISATSRTLLVQLQAGNPQERIRIGSYCRVRFASTGPALALTLPSSALMFRANGLQVGVVSDTGVVALRNVVLGRDFGRSVEVLSGVSESDRIIATPSDSLIDGMSVHVTPKSSDVAGIDSK
ncbi:MAG: Efflux transporter, family, subunit [Prosthecobacter sp.]|nr:Efflux transporter, family, subunit [Prosthecobacter sp.]